MFVWSESSTQTHQYYESKHASNVYMINHLLNQIGAPCNYNILIDWSGSVGCYVMDMSFCMTNKHMRNKARKTFKYLDMSLT